MSQQDRSSLPTRYGVIGKPISHSKSPAIHTVFAQQTKQALTYAAFEVEEADLEAFVREFFAGGGGGLNVTAPHKQGVFALAQVTTPRASLARAANTLYLDAKGHLVGDNTDGAGLLGDLAQNHGVKIAGKRLLMLGAGGATRGVLAAIADLPAAERPATITVANRTLEKAEALATDFAGKLSVTASSYAQAGETCYDILINGTSAGFGGELPPLSPAALGEGCCCYDMMYSSQQTAFQAWALSHGAALAPDGLGMLVGQAAEAFFVWRGVRPETESVIASLR